MSPRVAIPLILGVSALAVAFLFWLIYGFAGLAGETDAFSFLPAINAFLNAVSASCVIAGIFAIRAKRKRAHGWLMASATGASALFLVGYLLHHALHGDTRFAGDGWVRPVYFAILITHVILAVVVLPMVLTTLFFASARLWSAHRRMARWTYPVWIYVSVTGVLVFFFLRVWFPGV